MPAGEGWRQARFQCAGTVRLLLEVSPVNT